MRCEYTAIGDPCSRCRRTGRQCLWSNPPLRGGPSGRIDDDQPSAAIHGARTSVTPTERSVPGDVQGLVVLPPEGTLPSIYSTSQSATFVRGAEPDRSRVESMAATQEEQLVLWDYISMEDALQAIEL